MASESINLNESLSVKVSKKDKKAFETLFPRRGQASIVLRGLVQMVLRGEINPTSIKYIEQP